MNDSTLTALMGRVPARCIVLLEDLDAAFTRSTSRDGSSTGAPGSKKKSGDGKDKGNDDDSDDEDESSGKRGGKKKKGDDSLSDVNTLSLSGLLNALDGVAAAEGRILFATTNHLERLDPALSRPGRMDVWVEFKHASPWQAEALFKNFFPSVEEVSERDGEEVVEREGELDGVRLPGTPSGVSESESGMESSVSEFSLGSLMSVPSSPATSASASASPSASSPPPKKPSSNDFGSKNTAYLPPPPDPSIANASHSARPLDAATLNRLAKMFADAIPRDEFSVAALQGCECWSFSIDSHLFL
jgi:chaperone BCS1